MPLAEYPDFFLKQIKTNPLAIFHNANIYPTDFKEVSSITWYETKNPTTISESIQEAKQVYPMQMLAEQLLRRIPLLHKTRPTLDGKKGKESLVAWRNHEMSSSVNSLEPLLRFPTTTVLQEYFIPLHQLTSFVAKVRALAKTYDINILNISIRYVPQNKESILSYARNECFSLVFYINITNTQDGLEDAEIWTQKLIDAALALNGTYYLPYQLFGTQTQIRTAYLRFDEFAALKKKYDPNNRFSNCFLKKYKI